jgi:hypothetical protein
LLCVRVCVYVCVCVCVGGTKLGVSSSLAVFIWCRAFIVRCLVCLPVRVSYGARMESIPYASYGSAPSGGMAYWLCIQKRY